jgi:DNA-binding transcriptional LysR family regulator
MAACLTRSDDDAMFEWDDARYFLAVHRSGSLSAAARQLGVNQSTVGRRLATLEEHLGAKVFVRTRDGYRIAPAGERLLPHAERMEDEAIAVEREVTGQETTLTGTVRITASDLFASRIITALLVELHARYPDIEIDLDTSSRVRSLTRREADIAVRVGGIAERGVAARKVGVFASAAYASKAYVEAHGRPRGDDWSGHDFVGFAQDYNFAESRWLEARASKGRVVFRAYATLAQLNATLAGIGIGMLPCYVGDAEADLVRLVPPSQFVRHTIYLIVHEDLRQAARIRACADFLAEGLRRHDKRLRGEP